MKTKSIWLGLAMAVVLLVAGCTGGGNPGGNTGLEGTWVDGVNTIVITASTFGVSNAGGTLDCSINNVDSGAGHILMTVTSSTGVYPLVYTPGTLAYVTYVLNGNTLVLDMQPGSYPAAATMTFTRQ